MQDRLLSRDFGLYESVVDQASTYVRALAGVTKGRAVLLVGHSSGGVVAFEMARQLIEQGWIVKHLFIFDSWAKLPFDIEFKEQFIQAIYRQAEKIKPELFFHSGAEMKLWLDVLWHRMITLMEYRPANLDIEATLFAAQEELVEYPSASSDYGWSDFINNLHQHQIPGNHETILSAENIALAAEQLNNIL